MKMLVTRGAVWLLQVGWFFVAVGGVPSGPSSGIHAVSVIGPFGSGAACNDYRAQLTSGIPPTWIIARPCWDTGRLVIRDANQQDSTVERR